MDKGQKGKKITPINFGKKRGLRKGTGRQNLKVSVIHHTHIKVCDTTCEPSGKYGLKIHEVKTFFFYNVSTATTEGGT